MDKNQAEALYGPASSFSEHRVGTEIKFRGLPDGSVEQGKILHVRAPGNAVIDGDAHSLLYIVDCNDGMPVPVAPSQIVEGTPKPQPFTAILGTYGLPDSALHDRAQAEDLVWHLDTRGKYVIDTDHGKLRVLSARIEGDEARGRIIAECEAVIESDQEGE